METADSTLTFVASLRDKTLKSLLDKEERLAQFLAVHPEFAQDVMMPTGATPLGASIRAYERKAEASAVAGNPLAEALERQRRRLAARLAAIDNPPPLPMTPRALDPVAARVLDQARTTLERAQARLDMLAARYTDRHPDVRTAAGEVQAASAAFQAALAAVEKTRPAPEPGPPVASDKERKEIAAQLAQVQSSLQTTRGRPEARPDLETASTWIVDLETRWAVLNRDVQDARERHLQIERRYFRASVVDNVEASGGAAQMIVVDPAYQPERPHRRGPRRVAAAAAAVVLALGMMLVLGLAHVDDRVFELDELDDLELDGFLQSVPRIRGARHG